MKRKRYSANQTKQIKKQTEKNLRELGVVGFDCLPGDETDISRLELS